MSLNRPLASARVLALLAGRRAFQPVSKARDRRRLPAVSARGEDVRPERDRGRSLERWCNVHQPTERQILTRDE